jgi:transposase
MAGYIEGWDRRQRLLLPDSVDDYVGADSPIRVIDAFIDVLDLEALGFDGSAATGRPSYHPATMLKLYVYGYLNQVQSSRKLEREAGRNVEVMWLTGKLVPDFKTIADFRRDNGAAIRATCRKFVDMCRQFGLIASGTVAVDGSRFKAVNTRDKNFTPGAVRRRMEQVDASIQRYLDQLETADRQEDGAPEWLATRLTGRIDALRRRMRELQAMETRVATAPDRQVSLTDPDARAMATHGKGTGLVGYNVQAAVDTNSHIVVAHEVTNIGHDRTQLASMSRQAKQAVDAKELTVLADRGYFSGPEILACEALGVTPICPRPTNRMNDSRSFIRYSQRSSDNVCIACSNSTLNISTWSNAGRPPFDPSARGTARSRSGRNTSKSTSSLRRSSASPLADNSRSRSSTSNNPRCCPNQIASLAQQQGIKIGAGSARGFWRCPTLLPPASKVDHSMPAVRRPPV